METLLADDLSRVYFNPSHSSGFSGKRKLYSHFKNKISNRNIDKWARGVETYTLHKPYRKKFTRREYTVGGIDSLWEIDLTDVSSLSKYNKGHKFILFAIDVFSRYAFAKPLKNKTASVVTAAFARIMLEEKRTPDALASDKGSEFRNSKFQSMLKSKNIHHYTTDNDDIKASHIERFQRTIKEKMYRYFTHTGNQKYLDVLPKLLNSYNNTVHSSLNVKPSQVNSNNYEDVWIHQHIPDKPIKSVNFKYKFNIGDKVRISKQSHAFKKGYKGNWSQEVFEIRDRRPTIPPVYFLQDSARRELAGTWYSPELQKVTVLDNVYKIEKILGQRKVGGKVQYLVRWLGYGKEFDSYIDKSGLIKQYKN